MQQPIRESTATQVDIEVASGAWLHNPATGELARVRVGSAETEGRRVAADLKLQPGAAVAGAHLHDHVVERFEVRRGRGGLPGRQRRARRAPGDETIDVAAGTVHDRWNAGDGVAHARVEVEAQAKAPGRPAARFMSMIEALWSLGALGRVNGRGMPTRSGSPPSPASTAF